MRLTLSKRIITAIEIAVIVSVISLGIIFYLFLQNNTKEEINARLMNLSYLKGSYINQYYDFHVSEVEQSINSMHIKHGIIDLLQNKKGASRDSVIALLLDGMVDKSVLINFSILDNSGVIVASSSKQEEGKIKTNEPYFIEGKKETVVKSFVYDSTSKKIILIIATPIRDMNGKVWGVYSQKIDTWNINLLMSDRLGLGKTGETFLINKSHVVTTSLLKEKETILRKTIYLPQINKCIEGNSSFYLASDYHGDKVFGYARWAPEIDSCIVSEFDYKEAMNSVFKLIPKLVLFIIIIFIMTLFFGYFIGQSIVKPLKVLRDKALKIKDGDMNIEIEPESNDEVGDMAVSFKEMLSKLKELYKNLENKVRERTEELEKSENKLAESLELSEKNNKMMINRELEMIKLKDQIKDLEESQQNNGK